MEKIKNKGKILTKEEYFGGNAVNSSSVKKLIDIFKKIKSPLEKDAIIHDGRLELIEKYFEGDEKKGKGSLKNLAIGSVIHDICLEKIDRIEAIKNNFIDYSDKKAISMIDLCCSRFADLNFQYQNPVIENCFFRNYKDFELKAKIDLVCEIDGKIVIVDLKTVSSCDAIGFNINKYNYWFQCLYYRFLIEEEGIDVDDMILIFLSKDEKDNNPYKVVKFSDIPHEFQIDEMKVFFCYLDLFYELRSFYKERECPNGFLKKILHI